MDQAIRPVARFGVHRFGQAGLNQPVEGPIGEGPTDSEHPPHLAIEGEVLRYGKPMGGASCEKAEDCVFGD